MAFVALSAFEINKEVENNKEHCCTIYKEALDAWIISLPEVGNLIGNHLLAIALIIGIVPSWFLDMYYPQQIPKGIQYY